MAFLTPPNKTYAYKRMGALNAFCEVLLFYLNFFSLVFVGKEFRKSCCQALVLVKVLSGLLLSQQENEKQDLFQPTPPKRCVVMFTSFAHNLTRSSPKL